MINILMNKLPESKDKDIIWKINNPELYKKFCQDSQNQETVQETTGTVAAIPTKIPKVLNVIPIPMNRLPTVLSNSPVVSQDIPNGEDVQVVEQTAPIINKNIPKRESKESKESKVSKVSKVSKTSMPKKVSVNKNKNSPMKIILEESQTYDTYRDDVRDKIIKFISTKEFNKVFGITKSAEIMSGIANDRFNKSTALFISFLFDKCVIYNDKNFIYNKNNGVITI
jgi:hypothetical protein